MICREHIAHCMVCGAPVPPLERVLTRKDVLSLLLAIQATDMDLMAGKPRDAENKPLLRTPFNFINELALRLTRSWESPRT